jgi:hypothetical protein
MAMRGEVHRFHSVSAMQAFITTLVGAQRSYRAARVPHPKPGKPPYMVMVYPPPELQEV